MWVHSNSRRLPDAVRQRVRPSNDSHLERQRRLRRRNFDHDRDGFRMEQGYTIFYTF